MDYTSTVSIDINAPTAKVWEALTNPALIKQYLFGTETVTDWKVGSPIIYKGEWEDKTYEDKGTILKFEPEQVLETTYWSSMSGTADIPENYKKVSYEITPIDDNKTKLTITQNNNATDEEKNHTEQNWKMVLDGLKKLVEQ